MGKKNFDNINKNTHLGGSLNSLITGKKESLELEEKQNLPAEVPKTFTMILGDYEYLQAYSRYMAFHSNSKYPLKKSLSDAIKLLRESHPEVTID